jgi:hypothetical protein
MVDSWLGYPLLELTYKGIMKMIWDMNGHIIYIYMGIKNNHILLIVNIPYVRSKHVELSPSKAWFQEWCFMSR